MPSFCTQTRSHCEANSENVYRDILLHGAFCEAPYQFKSKLSAGRSGHSNQTTKSPTEVTGRHENTSQGCIMSPMWGHSLFGCGHRFGNYSPPPSLFSPPWTVPGFGICKLTAPYFHGSPRTAPSNHHLLMTIFDYLI